MALLVRRIPGPFGPDADRAVAGTVSCCAIWWRYTSTLSFLGYPVSLVLRDNSACSLKPTPAVVLVLGYFPRLAMNRRRSLPEDMAQWPTVDIFIADLQRRPQH